MLSTPGEEGFSPVVEATAIEDEEPLFAEVAAYANALRRMQNDIIALLDSEPCHPILIRLAWHDSGTFDAGIERWPHCGGANGSIRFDDELLHSPNAGLAKGLRLLERVHAKNPMISWADLIQMASAEAIVHAGGPRIPLRYGRVDSPMPFEEEGNLPDALPPFSCPAHAKYDAAAHLRAIFYRMGFEDQDIVALSGAHTMGRSFKERSGTTSHSCGAAGASRYTLPTCARTARGLPSKSVEVEEPFLGMPGGMSWTPSWLHFDNSYFTLRTAQTCNGCQQTKCSCPIQIFLCTSQGIETRKRRSSMTMPSHIKDSVNLVLDSFQPVAFPCQGNQ